MTIKHCPVCDRPAQIRYRHTPDGLRTWVQCELCGLRTREYIDVGQPSENSLGGKWAVITWNSQDFKQL